MNTPESGETAPRCCARCLYTAEIPAIEFDETGVCNYCRLHDQLDRDHPTGAEGWRRLEGIAAEIRRHSRGRAYDVAVGVSGGCDSSYMIHLARELGLRPLAVHFDNTWNSTTAVENIHRVLGALKVELFTYVVDNEEYDDIYRAFLAAGLPDIEAPTDIALATTMYLAAAKHGIRYIFEGHSFRTEGVSPLGWLYMDAKYIATVHRRFGRRPMKTYPNLWLGRWLWWMVVKGIKKIRPLYYVDFHKEKTKAFLAERYGWKWYGGHHLENRFTAFYHSYFLPRRFGIDGRLNGFSALVRSGQMTREEGLAEMAKPPYLEEELVAMVRKRLGYSEVEFETIMNQPKHYYTEFETYKPLFERYRALFGLLARLDLVPRTFYVKYCSKKNL